MQNPHQQVLAHKHPDGREDRSCVCKHAALDNMSVVACMHAYTHIYSHVPMNLLQPFVNTYHVIFMATWKSSQLFSIFVFHQAYMAPTKTKYVNSLVRSHKRYKYYDKTEGFPCYNYRLQQ